MGETKNSYRCAKDRYRLHRKHARDELEAQALATLRFRVDAVSIDDDIIRKFQQQWVAGNGRLVDWDWDTDIVARGVRSGARHFNVALLVKGQLCAMAAARVSPRKQWLSLTHIEGCPQDHPLKGLVLPLVVNALYIYRAVICEPEDVNCLGIRVLNPLNESLASYARHGYTVKSDTKWLRAIVIEEPHPRTSLGGIEHAY